MSNDFRYQMDNEQFVFFHSMTTNPNPTGFVVHTHDTYELLYLLSGSVAYRIEGNNYQMKPCDIIFTNSRELHKTVVNPDMPYERKFIRFKQSFILGLEKGDYNVFSALENRKLGFNNRIEAKDVLKYNLDHDINAIHKYSLSGKPDDVLMIRVMLIKLLVSINRCFAANKKCNTSTTKVHEDVKQILDYINCNLEAKITHDHLERKFNLTKYHLSRVFKRVTGFSVTEYITYKRIMKAREMLADKGVSANDVATSVGYTDYSNFYRAFKKITGVPPSQFGN